MMLMKAITSKALHFFHMDKRAVPQTIGKQPPTKPDTDQVESTVWVMIVVFLTLIATFAYLFWRKF